MRQMVLPLRKLHLKVTVSKVKFQTSKNDTIDAKDETRKKSVTFANPTPVMAQSPSHDSLGSALSQTSSNPTGQVDILRLSPWQEVGRVAELSLIFFFYFSGCVF